MSKIFTIAQYEDEAMKFASYPRVWSVFHGCDWPLYAGLSLLGETGEISKQVLFGWNDTDTVGLFVTKVMHECGDVLWSLAAIAHDFGEPLAEIMDETTFDLFESCRLDSRPHRTSPLHLVHKAMTLSAHAGEFVETHIKKPWHHCTKLDVEQMRTDLLRIVRTMARLVLTQGWTLQRVAQANIDKLESRAARGVLKGHGSDR